LAHKSCCPSYKRTFKMSIQIIIKRALLKIDWVSQAFYEILGKRYVLGAIHIDRSTDHPPENASAIIDDMLEIDAQGRKSATPESQEGPEDKIEACRNISLLEDLIPKFLDEPILNIPD